MSIQQRKASYRPLALLCAAVYFVSYFSRINLSAVMVELINSGFATKTTAALALTVCSVTYGFGQILCGYLGDRFKPQNVILCGFLLTGAMNLSVGFLQDPRYLTLLWAFNGLAQACMWPPLLAIMTQHFNSTDYTKAQVWVNVGCYLATMTIYAYSPLVIRFLNFRWVFFISGAVALVMAVIWKLVFETCFAGKALYAVPVKKEAAPAATHRFDCRIFLLMGLVMVAIALQGALRDGVTNWMPTLVSDSFHMDSSSAIFAGVLMPIFQIVCSAGTAWIYRRFFRNEMTCAGVFFLSCMVTSLLLAGAMKIGPIPSVILLALLVGSTSGVNFTLVSLVPRSFRKYGHVSLVSGVLNSSTYIGSAISTYGIALLSEAIGWNGTVLMWCAIALGGALICLGLTGKWKNFTD